MMKKIIFSLTLTFLVGLTINVEKVQHEIENLNFEIGMFVASAFADPPTDPEECEEDCGSGGLSCDNLSNCQDGASCSGSGFMQGPCTFTCGTTGNPGPKSECGEL